VKYKNIAILASMSLQPISDTVQDRDIVTMDKCWGNDML